mmetsp:Transcript_32661/g.68101  ORF Transcript_32661/g.68101 Transcript_32661/m.68101 type:complete len:342 (+) Transcript_32661:39-1064(+)
MKMRGFLYLRILASVTCVSALSLSEWRSQQERSQAPAAFKNQQGRPDSLQLDKHKGAYDRRTWLSQGIGSLVGASILAGSMLLSEPVLAAEPISLGEAQNVGAQTKRLLRAKPPKILRPRLDRDFAVLLMRSSYNSLDELDCVAMDQFQRDFFIIRQAEYEPYVNLLGPGMVSQGDLTDPYYFDFISFAQYTTISREITQDPPFVFVEKQPVEVPEGEPQQFKDTVIRRDPSISNDKLASEHGKLVGTRILDRLNEVFDNTASAIPKYNRDSDEAAPFQLLAAMQQLAKLFALNGYALDGSASMENSGKQLQLSLTLTSPATIWSGQALSKERSAIVNTFL